MADENHKDDHPESPDIYFEPLVNLPPVELKTLEEDEEELLKVRAKLFRYDNASDPPEWKERGVGDVKILHNKEHKTCRILMRRDKTLKICANHYVLPHMELKPNCGSDRAWVWSTPSDFADEEATPELLAIRFANAANAKKFEISFNDAKKVMRDRDDEAKDKGDDTKKSESVPEEKQNGAEENKDDVVDKLAELSVKDDDKKTTDNVNDKDKDKDKEKDSAGNDEQKKE